jgi:triosephosphate isomerase
MRRKIIAGNWKMNGTIPQTKALLQDILAMYIPSSQVMVVVCPPFPALEIASQMLQGKEIKLGAQDMSPFRQGAYTGDVSADMLLTAGAEYVILGHSERRQYHAETDELINEKVKTALATGLIPIICVGELLEQREADQTEDIIGRQVNGVLSGLTPDQIARVVIAYEPVWAIGTGKTATPEQAQAVHTFIRQTVAQRNRDVAMALPILYGGSVKSDNAVGLLHQPDIDGALVGGASLKAKDFVQIILAA